MPAECDGLIHIALFYDSDAEYLDAVVPFLREGIENGESVMVVVPEQKLVLLRGALGDAEQRISLADMADVGRNPARTFPLLEQWSERNSGRLRVVAEPVYPGREADAYPACVQNEALFNAAFATRPLTTLCPYDTVLGHDVLADARRTHPRVRQAGTVSDSDEFSSSEALALSNLPLPLPPDAHTFAVRRPADLSGARDFVARHATSAGLSAERVGEVQLIATELATNSLEHGGEDCTVAMWRRERSVICQVDDGGHLDNLLAGRQLPDDRASRGRGLFLVNALADLVRTHTTGEGTTIRAYLNLDRAPAAPVG